MTNTFDPSNKSIMVNKDHCTIIITIEQISKNAAFFSFALFEHPSKKVKSKKKILKPLGAGIFTPLVSINLHSWLFLHGVASLAKEVQEAMEELIKRQNESSISKN